MKILVINGPNINMLGIREPEIYGKQTYKDLCNLIEDYAKQKNIDVEIFQSNHEGDIIDKIQQAYFDKVDGIVINPAGYTHTSVAIADAIKGVCIPTVEVHISKVSDREAFRQISYVRDVSVATVDGKGLNSYIQAIDTLLEINKQTI